MGTQILTESGDKTLQFATIHCDDEDPMNQQEVKEAFPHHWWSPVLVVNAGVKKSIINVVPFDPGSLRFRTSAI